MQPAIAGARDRPPLRRFVAARVPNFWAPLFRCHLVRQFLWFLTMAARVSFFALFVAAILAACSAAPFVAHPLKFDPSYEPAPFTLNPALAPQPLTPKQV